MKKSTAITLGVVIVVGGAVAYAISAGYNDTDDEFEQSPIERQSQARRDHARAMQDTMRDQGAGRITIDTTDYGDVTLRFDMPGCDSNFLSNFTAAPKVQRKLKELRFSGVMCEGGLTKLGPSDW